MKRHIVIGPETITSDLGTIQDFLDEVQGNGAPDDAKVNASTTGNAGTIQLTIEYDEELQPATQPAV